MSIFLKIFPMLNAIIDFSNIFGCVCVGVLAIQRATHTHGDLEEDRAGRLIFTDITSYFRALLLAVLSQNAPH